MAADGTDREGQGRDQAIDGLLRDTLARVPETAEECPPAEIMAAHYEQSLDKAERARVELHFAKCADCREMLAAMDHAAPLAGAREAKEEAERPHSNWAWLWDWRWLAPATAVLALAGIWFARPRESERVAQNFSNLPVVAESRPAEPVAPPAPTGVRQEDQSTAALSAPQPEKQVPTAKKSAEKPLGERKELPLNAPTEAETDALKNNLEQPNRDAALSDVQAAQFAPPRTAAVGGVLSAGDGGSAGARAARSAVPATPVYQPQANSGTPAAAPRMATRQTLEQRSSELRISTPDPNVIWRVSGGGFVERTTDAGKSWQGQQPRMGSQILAGSAPSATVCWLAGRAGVVLATADGMNWTTASAPASADLINVAARDASSATVATADGKKFSTADGGKTWMPLQ